VQIAQETGKSPFDPKVIREARRRVARELDAEIKQALQDPLPNVITALRTIHGRVGDRKIFIAALWDKVGPQVGMTLPEFQQWLYTQHRQQRLDLTRADFVAAMPQDLVQRSELKIPGASFHFVVDPSI
jgi:hypothetical protein